MRERLRRADNLLRERQVAEAVALYALVADEFERTGFAVKSIAVSRQIVSIVGSDRPDLGPARAVALERLARLCRQLGLTADAEEAERLLQSRPADCLH